MTSTGNIHRDTDRYQATNHTNLMKRSPHVVHGFLAHTPQLDVRVEKPSSLSGEVQKEKGINLKNLKK